MRALTQSVALFSALNCQLVSRVNSRHVIHSAVDGPLVVAGNVVRDACPIYPIRPDAEKTFTPYSHFLF